MSEEKATTLGHGPKTIKEAEGLSQQPVVDVDHDPKTSPITLAVCLAVALGYRWALPKPYSDVIEDMGNDIVQRRVTWCFDADSICEIGNEDIKFAAFWKRFHSGETDHNVVISGLQKAFQRAVKLEPKLRSSFLGGTGNKWLHEAAHIYTDFLGATMPRFIYVKQAHGRDLHQAYIPFGTPKDEVAKILAEAGIV